MQHGVMMPPINMPSHPGMMMPLAGGPGYPPPPPGVPPPGAVPMPIRPPMPPPPLPVGGAGMMPPLPIPPGVNNIMSGETIMRMGAGGSTSSIAVQKNNLHLNYHPQNAAQTVVLTHLPAFLRGVRILRDASYPCGSARTVHVGCCAPTSEEEGRKMMERGLLPSALVAGAAAAAARTSSVGASGRSGGGGANELEKKAMELLSWKGANGGVAVVKMGHFTGAQNFAGGMLALVRCKGETLPPKPGPDGIVREKCVEANNGIEDNTVEDENAAGEDAANPPVNENTNHDGDNKMESAEYTKDEEAKHLETLRQLKNMHVYHLFNYHIPDPIPPDMNIPQTAPLPQDPAAPYHLLEALTTLRLRYEESVKEAEDMAKSGKDPLSTSVSYIHDDEWGGHAAAAAGEDDHAGGGIGGFKLDKAKIAAAAGGVAGYDEEADPLNAPEVIKAVLAFKRQLEQQNVNGKRRRIEVVSQRMEMKVKEMLERGRKELEEMKLLQERQLQQKQEQEQEQQLEPVIPIAERKDVEDTGRRGVSNLPAWMTKGEAPNGETGASTAVDQKADVSPPEVVGIDDGDDGKKRKFVPSEANRDINMRKQKLDVVEGSISLSEIRAANEAADKAAVAAAASAAATPFVVQTTKEGILSSGSQFPPLSSEAVDTLKQYVTAQIIDYLGEEESTLIEFIVMELRKESGCTTLSLLEEMKVVLDEDAEEFVLGLYRKMVE